MVEKKIVIWGAGRIGRGFIGDLFSAAGYELIYIDEEQALVDGLRKEQTYRVIRATGVDQIETVDIKEFSIFHTSETHAIQDEINQTDLIALAVYPKNFQLVAEKFQDLILSRKEKRGDNAALDILLCTNLIHSCWMDYPIWTLSILKKKLALLKRWLSEFARIRQRMLPGSILLWYGQMGILSCR